MNNFELTVISESMPLGYSKLVEERVHNTWYLAQVQPQFASESVSSASTKLKKLGIPFRSDPVDN